MKEADEVVQLVKSFNTRRQFRECVIMDHSSLEVVLWKGIFDAVSRYILWL